MKYLLILFLILPSFANAQKSYSKFRKGVFKKECIETLSYAKSKKLIKLYNQWKNNGKVTADFHYDYAGLLLHVSDSMWLGRPRLDSIELHFTLHDDLETDMTKGHGQYNLWILFWHLKELDKAAIYMKTCKELLTKDFWNVKTEAKFIEEIKSD